MPPSRPRSRAGRRGEAPKRAPRPGLGTLLVAALFGLISVFGAVRGGEYQAFVEENGALSDVAARILGFSIGTVSITGIQELTPDEILSNGDITPKKSLAFLDPSALRDRLRSIPMVKEASVRKLFPDDLSITLTERVPTALWQKDGQVALIAHDGVPIDDVRDDRFNTLPFVVGDGANGRLDEYKALLDAAGELKDKVRAGILVGTRRWTLKMDSGVQVELPEIGAVEALGRLAELERRFKVLEKDVISIDLRIPDRLIARLSEDAAAHRAEVMAKKPKKASST